jgi:hypothetical protein
LTEIACPSDCPYLASAREHPPAAVVRRRERDLSLVVHGLRDFSQRQSHLFLAISRLLGRYEAPALQPLTDDDIIEACGAVAATFETAARGVIYEHVPASQPAARLAAALRPALVEAGQGGGSAFERDAAVVLRRVADLARGARAGDASHPRAFLELLARVLPPDDSASDGRAPAEADAPRLIVP